MSLSALNVRDSVFLLKKIMLLLEARKEEGWKSFVASTNITIGWSGLLKTQVKLLKRTLS